MGAAIGDPAKLEAELRGLRYELKPGRIVSFDGADLFSLERCGSPAYGYELSPADADEFAKRVVAGLNAKEFGDGK